MVALQAALKAQAWRAERAVADMNAIKAERDAALEERDSAKVVPS